MVDHLLSTFVEKYCDQRPLLLALSGGPDSRFLFHQLVKLGHPFQVAHVDHGWREESGQEAQALEALCREHAILFHLQTLDPKTIEGNREDGCRCARYRFFKEIIEREGLFGVMVAHHGDDQAETVLKRLFEGASLPKLSGLKPLSQMDGIILLRPLLSLQKKDLLKWLNDHSIPYFVDETNFDQRYLRAQMRQELIPELSRLFGKGIASSLCRIGQSAAELAEFLESMVVAYRHQVVRHPDGVALNLSEQSPESLYLRKTVLRDFFEKEGVTIPQTILESVLFHLENKSMNKQLIVGKRRVVIHRQCVKLMS